MIIIYATNLAQDGRWHEAMGETHCKFDANLESYRDDSKPVTIVLISYNGVRRDKGRGSLNICRLRPYRA